MQRIQFLGYLYIYEEKNLIDLYNILIYGEKNTKH